MVIFRTVQLFCTQPCRWSCKGLDEGSAANHTPSYSWKSARRWNPQVLLLLVLIHPQHGLGLSNSVIAGLYLAMECLDNLGLSQFLVHHTCQLLSVRFFRR